MTRPNDQGGFTLVELTISLILFAVVALGVQSLFVSLVNSAVVSKQIAVASTLATNQLEYLKSLPYDNLAVVGGSIYSANPLPASSAQTVNGVHYTIKTNVVYVDEAYDGCGSYPNQTLKQTYCLNYPAPAGAPAVDTNPADYKHAVVAILDSAGHQLAEQDTDIAAKVAETASTTGALFVSVVDDTGNPITDATVTAVNSVLSPVVSLSGDTDQNGITIFYGLPPDTSNYDYTISASKGSYSSLTTIKPSGALQPTYPSQKIFTQQSSLVTLTLKQQGVNSLLIQATDTSGNPLSGAKIYAKGGYKKYTATTDTTYYYDSLSPSDTRPITDTSGYAALSNLVPGNYIFCGDSGATSCSIGGVTYYLAAAVPYGGANSLNPITVPIYDASSPPPTTFPYGGVSYLQEVRLMLTSSSTFPRVINIDPDSVSLTSPTVSNLAFTISGVNLPCSANAGSCATTVKFIQGANTYTASCTGSSGGLQLACSVNLSTASAGYTQLMVSANGFTLTLPAAPLIGGILVTP